MNGHFIAYCKDPLSNVWYKYNDSFVNEVTNFQKEVIDFAMPYLLFYQKVR
jgi:ubiquitin C-terminal hydrolase